MSTASFSVIRSSSTTRESLRSSNGDGGETAALGIDLGGTSIKFGLFRGGHLVARSHVATLDYESPALAFTDVRNWLRGELASIEGLDAVSSIGLAMPGVLIGGGTLAETANLHQWQGVNFGDELASVFRQQPVVINDANAAAMGEFAYARLDSATNLIFLTLGTGVGGGVIVGGFPVQGEHHCGGEIGHAVVDFAPSSRMCGCGFPGHLEAYVGSAGIVRTMQEVLEERQGDDAPIGLRIAVNSPEDVARLAEKGDEAALETIRRTGRFLGRSVAAAATVTNPREFVLGGAINFGGADSLAGEHFLTAIHEEVKRTSLREVSENLIVRFAALGGKAGLYGAAYYAEMTSKRQTSEGI